MKKPPFSDASPGWGLIAATWIGMLGLLYVVFDGVIERQNRPKPSIAQNPVAGVQELVLKRNRAGHYVAPGAINGRPVIFLLDTGATWVAVPAPQGPALGLTPGARGTSQTANGSVAIRFTTIDRLTLGPFELRGIPAALNPGMDNDEILLGMSVLKHLEFTQRGNTLILRPHRA